MQALAIVAYLDVIHLDDNLIYVLAYTSKSYCLNHQYDPGKIPEASFPDMNQL